MAQHEAKLLEQYLLPLMLMRADRGNIDYLDPNKVKSVINRKAIPNIISVACVLLSCASIDS